MKKTIPSIPGLSLALALGLLITEPTSFADEDEDLIAVGEVIWVVDTGSYGSSDWYRERELFLQRYPEGKKPNGAEVTLKDLKQIQQIVEISAAVRKKSPAWKLDDQTLIEDIFFKQDQLISMWENSVDIFNKVLTTESRKDASPDFSKAAREYFEKKVIDTILVKGVPGMEALPGMKEVVGLFDAVGKEYDKAKKANENLQKRDFHIEQMEYATLFRQALGLKSDEAKALTQATIAAGMPASGSQHWDYSETVDVLKQQLADATPANMFLELSQMWISQSTVEKERAYIVVKVDENYKATEAQMVAPSGQQISEKLNEYFPKGVTVFGLRDVPIRVIQMSKDATWPTAIVLVENKSIASHPSYPNHSEALAKAVYEGLIDNKIRFKTK